MPGEKEEEITQPWSASNTFVAAMLDHNRRYLAFWKSKQIKFLTMGKSALLAVQGMGIQVPWLANFFDEYMSLCKYENGNTIKLAMKVAASGVKSKLDVFLSRFRRVQYGSEPME